MHGNTSGPPAVGAAAAPKYNASHPDPRNPDRAYGRFGTVNGRDTEVLIAARMRVPSTGAEKVIIGLPWGDEHTGSWQRFEVASKQGTVVPLRLTTINPVSLKGMRLDIRPIRCAESEVVPEVCLLRACALHLGV